MRQGLGDIQGNEVSIACNDAKLLEDAATLIMSLWQVPDKQTSMLMTTFCKVATGGYIEYP
ncbi:MAG: hypothetical protein U0T81_08710 [Saprospiraceae bacterium]